MMNISTNTPHKILIRLLSLGLITFGAVPTLKAQDQNTPPPSTNSLQGINSRGGGWKKGPHHHDGAWASLTDAERQQLKADMGKIKNDPQLVAAREAVKDAQTKEAKHAAHRSLEQIRHDLLLKADPSIQPVLDKMHKGESGPSPESN
jgi:Spy/CpxP family protein refolding chaperone